MTLNSTSSSSISVRKPGAEIADWCTKRSSSPLRGAMKPNPFSLLNHLTFPICLPSVGSTPSGQARGFRWPPRPPPPPPPLSPLTCMPPGPVTLVAFILPFSSTASYSIFSPSPSERKPSAWIADWWTKRSSPPLSGVMKPKPFCELNHLTVPLSFMLTGGLRRGDAGAVREGCPTALLSSSGSTQCRLRRSAQRPRWLRRPSSRGDHARHRRAARRSGWERRERLTVAARQRAMGGYDSIACANTG
mmetsp:Transcript_41906/g.132298  ORF Transcript_41906/g.132298 Transcript_41906/m.132298 type:complete len:247 (-) Transcript_41906:19-759(-)